MKPLVPFLQLVVVLTVAEITGGSGITAARGGASALSMGSGYMLRPDASGGASTGRKYFIAGNWKMNPDTLEEAKALAQEVRSRCSGC